MALFFPIPTLPVTSRFPLINAVIEGKQEGKIFIPGPQGNYFVFHKAGFSFVAVESESAIDPFIDFIISNQNLPPYFHIYDPPEQITERFESRTDVVNIRRRRRIQLQFQVGNVLNNYIVPGFHTEKINPGNFQLFKIFELSLADKFWNSAEDFLENSFGFVVMDNENRPASVCYAACVANSVAEIDVATLPDYQMKGLAKMAVAAFVNHCNESGIIANWDCFEENTGSLKTAWDPLESTCRHASLSIL